jgi:glucosamine--fructose-6-phosphate aminotransferase (isomerizing)
MADIRTAHPYHAYEAIYAQPALVAEVLAHRETIEQAARAVAQKQRVIFVGIGTSLNAARVAESWLRYFSGGRIVGHAEQSFEFMHYPIALGPGDAVIVITHTGTTTASVEALRMARAAGALTVAITGKTSGEGVRAADFHIETCEQELAFAYTKSYTTALAALAILAIQIARIKNGSDVAAAIAELNRVPNLMEQALKLETATREWAARIAPLSRIEIFGSGAAWATASEAALKIKEACYIAAEGFETEEILHGPFSESDSRASMVGLFVGDTTDDRGRQILKAAGDLKMQRAVITVPSANRELGAEQIFLVPECSPWVSAFVHLVPLQLLMYHLALERRTSPDSGRMEEAEHLAASKHYKY